MRLLLDTHALWWLATAPEQIGQQAVDAVSDPSNEVCYSPASAWELATKTRIGKLHGAEPLLDRFGEVCDEMGLRELPITTDAALLAGRLEVDHRDPFDRMLAAQAIVTGCVLVTRDRAFAAMPVEVMW